MAQKKLYRSRTNRIIAGVAGGLGEYFDIDPVIIRLLFILLALPGGAGFLFYLVAWLIIPQEGETNDNPDSHNKHDIGSEVEKRARNVADEVKDLVDRQGNKRQPAIFVGLLLILVGALFFIQNLFGIGVWANFWPLILVILGLSLMVRSAGPRE